MAATLDLLGMLGRSMLRAALRLCCLPEQTIDGIERRHMQRDDGGAHLICYLDGMSEELVRRQLEFRRTRKLERSASRTSLSSLDAVSEVRLAACSREEICALAGIPGQGVAQSARGACRVAVAAFAGGACAGV